MKGAGVVEARPSCIARDSAIVSLTMMSVPPALGCPHATAATKVAAVKSNPCVSERLISEVAYLILARASVKRSCWV